MKINKTYAAMAVYCIFSILTSLTLFVWNWHGHANTVQEWTTADLVEYQTENVDWETYELPADGMLGQLNHDARESMIDVYHVFSVGPVKEARNEFRDVLTDLHGATNPFTQQTDIHELTELLTRVREAQTKFYDAVDVFNNNQLYAMYYTF